MAIHTIDYIIMILHIYTYMLILLLLSLALFVRSMHLFDIGDIFRARIYTSPIKCAQIIFGMVKRLFMISICINKQKNVKCAMAQYNVWTLWNLNDFPVRGAVAMCEVE